MRLPTMLADLIASLLRAVMSPKAKPKTPRTDRQAEIEREHEANRRR